MNYNRNLYPQKDEFRVDIYYLDSGFRSSSFGLSGDNSFIFNLIEGGLFCDGYLLDSLNESNVFDVSIQRKSGVTTGWVNGVPTVSKTGDFNFNNVFCQSPGNFIFYENVWGNKPGVSSLFSGWTNEFSGYMSLYNSGEYPLLVNSVEFDNAPLYFYESGFTIPASGSYNTLIISDGTTPFSGSPEILLETNAGSLSVQSSVVFPWVNTRGFVEVYFSNSFPFPSGSSEFFIKNGYGSEKEFEIFLDYVSGNAPSGGRFADIPATGRFSHFVNETVIGYKSFPVEYSGNFTGIGGRLGLTAVSEYTGSANSFVYAKGPVSLDYDVEASSIIFGDLYIGRVKGNLTGLVEDGSGYFNFSQQVTGFSDSAYLAEDASIIYPGELYTFTGQVSRSVNAVEDISGNINYFIHRTIPVFEGNSEFSELWNIYVDDLDRGTENFQDLGRINSSGYGETGIKFRVPANQSITGRVYFLSDYQKPFLSSMNLRVTDFTSINKESYIFSK